MVLNAKKRIFVKPNPEDRQVDPKKSEEKAPSETPGPK